MCTVDLCDFLAFALATELRRHFWIFRKYMQRYIRSRKQVKNVSENVCFFKLIVKAHVVQTNSGSFMDLLFDQLVFLENK